MSYNNLRKGRVSESGREYFITINIKGRKPVFLDHSCARIFIRTMMDASDKYLVLAFVVMPDHVHILIRLQGSSLSQVIKRLKAKSAIQINTHIGGYGQLWQENFYDHALRDEEDRKTIARYIVANPLRGGLVKNIGDYPHWDCIWL